MVPCYWVLIGFFNPVKAFCCSQPRTGKALPVPLILYNKASGYTTSLVTLQGMRTKVSVWNPEVGTFLKRLIQFFNWGWKHSTQELLYRKGFLSVDTILGKFSIRPLTRIWGLLSLVILTGFWDDFRSLDARTQRTVLERNQVLCKYKLSNSRNGGMLIGMLDSHAAWATAVAGVRSSPRLVTSSRGSREGISNWERMTIISYLFCYCCCGGVFTGFFLKDTTRITMQLGSGTGLDQILLLSHFSK